jgi:Ca-activated chloride channel family protein
VTPTSLGCSTALLLVALGQGLPVFPARTDLVVLHARVTDRGARVNGLTADAFRVREDGEPQAIRFFLAEDAPLTLGLVVDGSSSMFDERDQVLAAVRAFAATGRAGDERFALVFDRGVRALLPGAAPFTDDDRIMRQALAAAVPADGLTAFHDAVALALRHAQQGRHARRGLVVIGDGGDNASALSFRELAARAHASPVVIYTLTFADRRDPFARPGAMRRLAAAGRGLAFAPRSLGETEDTVHRIVDELRSDYTIGYVPARPLTDGERRRVRVTATARDGRSLTVSTRQEYVVDGWRGGAAHRLRGSQ